jgi:hypothetical protein
VGDERVFLLAETNKVRRHYVSVHNSNMDNLTYPSLIHSTRVTNLITLKHFDSLNGFSNFLRFAIFAFWILWFYNDQRRHLVSKACNYENGWHFNSSLLLKRESVLSRRKTSKKNERGEGGEQLSIDSQVV